MSADNEQSITLTHVELAHMLREAAHDGAKTALQEIGLGDDGAVQDVRDLREVMKAWRAAKKTAFNTIISHITTAIFAAILVGFAVKFGIGGK